MTSMTISELDPERDAAGVVALIRESDADDRHQRRGLAASRPDRCPNAAAQRAFVAEVGRRDRRSLDLPVRELLHRRDRARRSCGVGVRPRIAGGRDRLRALRGRARARVCALGAGRLLASVRRERRRASRSRGRAASSKSAREQESVLDPRTVPEAPPADVDLRRVADVDPHVVHAVDMTATRDMPSTEPIDAHSRTTSGSTHVLEHPLFTADGSFVAIRRRRAGRRLAALPRSRDRRGRQHVHRDAAAVPRTRARRSP